MTYENNYHRFGPERIDSTIQSDYKMSITIDAFPDDDSISGHVVAEVFLSQHDDIIVVWHDNSERSNTSVLELIKNSIEQLKEFKAVPTMHIAEKTMRDMSKYLDAHRIDKNLFGKEIEFIPLSAVRSYIRNHMHDFYDYEQMQQPEVCIHDGISACCYPINDCKNCPITLGEASLTKCTIE